MTTAIRNDSVGGPSRSEKHRSVAVFLRSIILYHRSLTSFSLRKLPYGGYAGVSQSENVELTDRDKEIIQRLKDWDLWGPLIVCLALAVLLSFKAPVGTCGWHCGNFPGCDKVHIVPLQSFVNCGFLTSVCSFSGNYSFKIALPTLQDKLA